jgi:predicted NUDIX family NTP pyrophosphohydrolase
MPKQSAGLLVYRRKSDRLEVLLAHPGGPFWAKKDDGAWSIPKGEVSEGEEHEACARREFREETGLDTPGPGVDLGSVKLKSGKVLRAWAVDGDPDLSRFVSNSFSMEWPPRSGRMQEFPEVDRAAFFGLDEARRKINAGQTEFLRRLEEITGGTSRSHTPSHG